MRLLSLFTEGLVMSFLSIIIVFIILYLITFSISLIKDKNKPVQIIKEPEKHILTLEDIKDEDMMVAVLTASIDYRNETKTDVRLVSVKEIN